MMKLTPTGAAGTIERCMRANFNPPTQPAEIMKLAELLQDVASSRYDEADTLDGDERRQALRDANWLLDVAVALGNTVPVDEECCPS